ncbi:hypothetical protein LIA77_00220 [Sarocladium implicatum]|nr:hypothetical protein LIA77_00220 [Sarocladium implicatum]
MMVSVLAVVNVQTQDLSRNWSPCFYLRKMPRFARRFFWGWMDNMKWFACSSLSEAGRRRGRRSDLHRVEVDEKHLELRDTPTDNRGRVNLAERMVTSIPGSLLP